MARATPRFVVSSLLLLALSLAYASTAHASLEFEHVGFGLTGPDGKFSRQAGAHPDFTTTIDFAVDPNAVIDGRVTPGPSEAVHAVDVDLPNGFIGNPEAAETCEPVDLANPGLGGPNCPIGAQIGVAEGVTVGFGGPVVFKVGLYNLAHGPDVPARFGFNYAGAVSTIDARVRPGDYGISSGSFAISEAVAVQNIKLTLWGVPADPSHDLSRVERGGFLDLTTPVAVPSQSPRVPFLSSPTSCSDTPVPFTIRGDSWENQGVYDARVLTADIDGTPFVFDGCEQLPFDPAVDVKPLSRVADAPTGLNVDLTVPQTDDPDGLATASVRRVVMTLPRGMSVSPSSAAGLGACAPAQIGLGSHATPTCPDSAELGKVTIDTPLLADPLVGDIILAKQHDNPFGSLIAMYIAVKGPGFYVKLPGRVDLDPNSGQLVATFDNTPQLPFSRMQVDFPGGSQAALASPTECGTYNTHAEITSWASDVPVSLDSSMSIDQGCTAPAFAPSFTAGTMSSLAGAYSPFTFTLTRPDRSAFFSSIDTSLPAGMLARIASVSQCAAGAAQTGACPADSLIGSTSVLSGPGAAPLGLKGRVYLTGPYKGAPFGLSIVVPTAGQAGPFDLGDVIVRAALHVDPDDAHVTVKSDPLPTIIEGIPLRLRQVNVTIDRDKFMLNPTSCQAKTIRGTFHALSGETSRQTQRFGVGGCGDLSFKPRLGLRLTGKGQRTTGRHPGVRATLRQTGIGESGIKKAVVKLPKALALDPDNAQALCEFEDGTKPDLENHCPKGSIVGRARLRTPLLDTPLAGNVYFVKNVRIDKKTGARIRTLPMLVAALRGEIAINLKGTSGVSGGRLVNTFATVPDAPVDQFNLNIAGGKNGILTVTDSARGPLNICRGPQTAQIKMDGHNGKFADYRTRVKTPCATKKKRR
jgi:hypothetical protein